MRTILYFSIFVSSLIPEVIAQPTSAGNNQIVEKIYHNIEKLPSQPIIAASTPVTTITTSTVMNLISIIISIVEVWGMAVMKLACLLIRLKPFSIQLSKAASRTEFYSSLADLMESTYLTLMDLADRTC